jgi:hypothetical protein
MNPKRRSESAFIRWGACLVLAGLSSAYAGNSYNLAFSTYVGGTRSDWIRDVCVDYRGNIIAVGGTQSPDFPTTPGAYCRTFHTGGRSLGSGGPCDVIVMKFSPAGQLLWSTFLGGPNYDRAYGVKADSQGYIYVAGRAGEGFPVTAGTPYQPSYGTGSGNYDGNAFMVIIAADFKSLLYSSFVGQKSSITGQNAYGGIHASFLTPDGDWIVGGSWCSSGWPNENAYQGYIGGVSPNYADAILARFVPSSSDQAPAAAGRSRE